MEDIALFVPGGSLSRLYEMTGLFIIRLICGEHVFSRLLCSSYLSSLHQSIEKCQFLQLSYVSVDVLSFVKSSSSTDDYESFNLVVFIYKMLKNIEFQLECIIPAIKQKA